MKSAAILNELSGRFEKLRDREQFESVLKDFSSRSALAWKDALKDTELAISDAVDLGASRLSLEAIFKSLSQLEAHYAKRVSKLVEEIGNLPEEFFKTFDRLGVELEKSIEILLKALHLVYLYSGDQWFLHLNALLYAATRAKGSRKLYCAAAVARFLSGRVEEALALAAYAADLRVRKPEAGPWMDPGAWASALLASYHLDVGIRVVQEVLSEYDFKKAFLDR